MPEPHILFTVVQPVESARPAPSADCRAAELWRGEALEFPLEGAHRGAGAGNNDDRIRTHGPFLSTCGLNLRFQLRASQSGQRRAGRATAVLPVQTTAQ